MKKKLHELATEFEEIFRGLQRAYGQYKIISRNVEKGKIEGKAQTVLGTPTIELWERHLSGEAGLGIIPINEDNDVQWGAIDIDVYPLDLNELEKKTQELGLPVIVCRTKSGGAHVFAFVATRMPARLMRQRMMQIAIALGYPSVEIYPKQVQLASSRDVGNWLNMPYFDVDRTSRGAISNGNFLTAEEFLEKVRTVRFAPEDLLGVVLPTSEYFNDGPPCLQVMAQKGVSQGFRNETLFAMGVYARMKHGDTWEEELENMNHTLVTPPLSHREVSAVIKSLTRKEYFYTCNRHPLLGFCNKDVCKHREFGVGSGESELTLQLGGLTKLLTDPPVWIVEVEGVRFELDTADLLEQARFARMCVDKINKWPGRMKPVAWQKMIQQKLDTVEEVAAPPDTGVTGRFMWYVEQFCVNAAPARAKDEILLGKPWTENGKHYFRAADLLKYMDQQHFRDITPRRAWATLRENGANHVQFNIKGRCVQCWAVPEFQKQVDEHDIPEIRGEEDF